MADELFLEDDTAPGPIPPDDTQLDRIEKQLSLLTDAVNQVGTITNYVAEMMEQAKGAIDASIGQLASNPMFAKLFGGK